MSSEGSPYRHNRNKPNGLPAPKTLNSEKDMYVFYTACPTTSFRSPCSSDPENASSKWIILMFLATTWWQSSKTLRKVKETSKQSLWLLGCYLSIAEQNLPWRSRLMQLYDDLVSKHRKPNYVMQITPATTTTKVLILKNTYFLKNCAPEWFWCRSMRKPNKTKLFAEKYV